MALSRLQMRAIFVKLGRGKKRGSSGKGFQKSGRPDGHQRIPWKEKTKREKALHTAQWISALDTLARPARWLYRGIKHRPGVSGLLAGGSATGAVASYHEGAVVDKDSKNPAILQRREHARKAYRRSRQRK